MTQTARNNNDRPNQEDPLNGYEIEDLELDDLQKLADHVYEHLRRELQVERDRLGLSYGQRPTFY